VSANPPAGDGSPAEPIDATSQRPAQRRIIKAAQELFAEHGVGGTSLQMIAERIGVTKAAVYHQYPTKEEIVIAVAGAELARVEAVLDDAEARPTRDEAHEVLVTGMVDLAVERRHMESMLTSDPVIVRHFAHHQPFQRVIERLYRMLMDGDAGPEARVRAALVTAAIGGAAMHPLAVDLDDETLRAELGRLARRILNPADQSVPSSMPAPSTPSAPSTSSSASTESAPASGPRRASTR
jgi:AcrR family transcriptional regulator